MSAARPHNSMFLSSPTGRGTEVTPDVGLDEMRQEKVVLSTISNLPAPRRDDLGRTESEKTDGAQLTGVGVGHIVKKRINDDELHQVPELEGQVCSLPGNVPNGETRLLVQHKRRRLNEEVTDCQVGDSLFIELARIRLKSQETNWAVEVNALNLRRATINEIKGRPSYYAQLIMPEADQEGFSDLITHWNEPGNGTGKEICWAIAEVLGAEIKVQSKNITGVFHPAARRATRRLYLSEEDGRYSGKEEVQIEDAEEGGAAFNSVEPEGVDTAGDEVQREKAAIGGNDTDHSKARKNHINIGTINCCGCSTEVKRDGIDRQLEELGIEVCGIQETRVIWEEMDTKNFKWFCSPCEKETSHRGVGILLKKSSTVQLKNFRAISENLCSAWVQKENFCLFLIVVHVPSDKRMPGVFASVSSLISKIPPEDDFIVIGDFNGRIGKQDVDGDFNHLVGGQLLHDNSNENGSFLIQLIMQFDLIVANTLPRSDTVLETWSSRGTSSQIDHILIPESSRVKIKENSLVAVKGNYFLSDHKVLKGTVRKTSFIRERLGKLSSRLPPARWNVKLLEQKKAKDKFQEAVKERVARMTPLLEQEVKWDRLRNIIKEAANETIPAGKKPPRSPKTKKAYEKLQRKRFRQMKFPDVDRCRQEVNFARAELERTEREHIWKEWKQFFANIDQVEPYMRPKLTFQFLKQHKQHNQRKSSKVQVMVQFEPNLSLSVNCILD